MGILLTQSKEPSAERTPLRSWQVLFSQCFIRKWVGGVLWRQPIVSPDRDFSLDNRRVLLAWTEPRP